ncbi:MAG: YwbE family protein [Anaerolineales bacterium]
MADLPKRNQIQPGMQVLIVEKHNQRSGLLTEGVVARILTKSPAHPHGIKVKLEDGKVGRVQSIVNPGQD